MVDCCCRRSDSGDMGKKTEQGKSTRATLHEGLEKGYLSGKVLQSMG